MKRYLFSFFAAILFFAAVNTFAAEIDYTVETNKTVDQAADDVKKIAKEHGFGTLTVHDFTKTLKEKGFDLEEKVMVLEVCKPDKAYDVLTEDIRINMALPCRISVFEENGKVKIGTLRPTMLLSILSDSEKLKSTAKEVEDTMIKIINAAK